MSDDLLTVTEVATKVQLSPQAVRRAIADGELPAVKLRGRVRIAPGDVRRWVLESAVPVQPRAAARVERSAPSVPRSRPARPRGSVRQRLREDLAT